jgi:hypothetical protein
MQLHRCLTEDDDLSRGGPLRLGLVAMFLSPWLAAVAVEVKCAPPGGANVSTTRRDKPTAPREAHEGRPAAVEARTTAPRPEAAID